MNKTIISRSLSSSSSCPVSILGEGEWGVRESYVFDLDFSWSDLVQSSLS